jgi:hypothetical protein
MKKILESGIGVLIIILVLYILFLHQCRGKDYWIPENKVLISKSLYDSLKNFKPTIDTILIYDTIKVDKPVYIDKPYPVPYEVQGEERHYKDSIVNDSIRIWDDLFVQGVIINWKRKYEPIIHTITQTVTVTVPQIIEQTVYNSDNGLYPSLVMGGNSNAFLFGAGIDLITKKDFMYGFQYQRFGNENFYSIRFGAKLKIFKHKN